MSNHTATIAVLVMLYIMMIPVSSLVFTFTDGFVFHNNLLGKRVKHSNTVFCLVWPVFVAAAIMMLVLEVVNSIDERVVDFIKKNAGSSFIDRLHDRAYAAGAASRKFFSRVLGLK